MQDVSYKYYKKYQASIACLILHGSSSAGINSPFIIKLTDNLAGSDYSVLAVNFPYCERSTQRKQGSSLQEEIGIVAEAIKFLKAEGHQTIIIVAKSLGGIVASLYLRGHPDTKIKLIILGYVLGDVDTASIQDNLKLIIQGENDRFGGKKQLQTEVGQQAKIIEIPNADHSYRRPDGSCDLQRVAIQKLQDWIEKRKRRENL